MRFSNYHFITTFVTLFLVLSSPPVVLCQEEEDDIEEYVFNKEECQAGVHEIDVSDIKTAPDIFNIRWKTTAGEEDIVIEIYREWAPIGVDRFYQLILDNYYNCAAFFRVVPNFVVQFGLASEPDETAKWKHDIEDDPVIQSNKQYTITYATAGPGTRTTQLFINLKDNTSLDSQGFTPFGKVVAGTNILTQIYNPTPGKSGGADQGAYTMKGNAWILQEYPSIDLIENTAMFTGPYQ